MTDEDVVLLELTIWREDRGGGTEGMHAVANAILNRAAKRRQSVYKVCTDKWQFSSVSAPGNPELGLWAEEVDPTWISAQDLARQAAAASLPDLTGGAVDYYAPDDPEIKASGKSFTLPDGTIVAFPEGWNPAVVQFTVSIGGHLFFKES